jgi:hypothetical protein
LISGNKIFEVILFLVTGKRKKRWQATDLEKEKRLSVHENILAWQALFPYSCDSRPM